MDCPLCDMKQKTQWFYKDERCVVCLSLDQDGASLRVMVTTRTHAASIHGDLYNYCMAKLNGVADMLTDDRRNKLRGYKIESKMRRVKGHWHMHARFHS